MTLTILPLFLANVLGVGTPVIGLIEGLAETTASLTKIFSGWLSDRMGQRKWLTVVGYGLSAISKPFLYFASAWGIVLGVRVADRVGKGIRTAPRDALIADSCPAERRGISFGFHRAADTAGAMLGLMGVALVVFLTQGVDMWLELQTYQTLVLVAIIPGFLAVLCLMLFVREVVRPKGLAHLPSLSLQGFDARFKIFLGIIVLFTLGNSSDAFLILRAQNLGLSIFQICLVLVFFNLVYTLVSAPAGALSDRIGRCRLIVAGWGVYAIIYLGFALANVSWHIWALFIVYGLYYGLAAGSASALVADVVRPEQRGTAYGIYNAAIGITAFPASFIAGLLWQGLGPWPGFGPSAPFFFGSALAVLALVLLVVWLPSLPQTAPERPA
jgi:MFS family permease